MCIRDSIYIALQDGTTASMTGLTIARNELHFGSIGVNGLERVSTSRCAITGNLVFDGNIGVGNGSLKMCIRDRHGNGNRSTRKSP